MKCPVIFRKIHCESSSGGGRGEGENTIKIIIIDMSDETFSLVLLQPSIVDKNGTYYIGSTYV